MNLFLDVVFDQTMFEPLCNSLKYFIMNNTTEIILFCTLRNPETYKQFLETLSKQYLYIINTCIFIHISDTYVTIRLIAYDRHWYIFEFLFQKNTN